MKGLVIFIFIVLFSKTAGFAQGFSSIEKLTIGEETSIDLSQIRLSAEDTFSYDVKLIHDQQKKPQCYYTQLVTPVCETGVCNLVAISVYWDLSGNYLGYQLPSGKILTKLDHKPFSIEDYKKLDLILKDRYWSLASYDINDLIIDSTKTLVDSEIDAYSGATAKFVNPAENIEGALYTIYTLWKFIHEPDKVEVLVAHTLKLMDQEKINLLDFLQSDNLNYHKLAVKILKSRKNIDDEYLDPLLCILIKNDQYLAYDILQIINIADPDMQLKLWDVYQQVEIYKKRDIIHKLGEKESSDKLLLQISLYLSRLQHYPEARLLVKFLEKHQPLPTAVRKTIESNSFKSKKVEKAIASLLN